MAKKISGILSDVQRLPSSRYGNPRYELVVDGKIFRTQVDGSVGYEVTNHKIGSTVTLTVERGTSVIDMVGGLQ